SAPGERKTRAQHVAKSARRTTTLVPNLSSARTMLPNTGCRLLPGIVLYRPGRKAIGPRSNDGGWMSGSSAAGRSNLALWVGAFAGFYRPGVEEVRHLDAASKFLYSARSVILVISAQAAIIAGLLALGARRFDALSFVLVLAGFVCAHMISNLSNDYFGYKRGHDTPDSPRMRYTVHPLASGVLDSRILLTGLAIVSAIGLAIMAFFIVERGWTAVAFAAAGIALLFLYDAAP